MVRMLGVLLLGVASVLSMPARGALVSQGGGVAVQGVRAEGSDGLEARQYRLPERRVAGQETVRQSVTAWEVTSGSWNGVSLEGLSLVLVQSKTDDGDSTGTTNCYVSHLATAAQRNALLSAYVASQSMKAGEVSKWRVEAAVITFEVMGGKVVMHLGLVA